MAVRLAGSFQSGPFNQPSVSYLKSLWDYFGKYSKNYFLNNYNADDATKRYNIFSGTPKKDVQEIAPLQTGTALSQADNAFSSYLQGINTTYSDYNPYASMRKRGGV